MKLFLYSYLFLLFTWTASGQTSSKKLIASTCEGRGCSGSEYCTACKNCSGCKHCAKEGGTCGVCAAAPKKKTISKKVKSSKSSKEYKKPILKVH